MTDCTRRDWLRLISAAGLTIGATHLSADDGHQVSTSTVHDDIREELDAAPLSLRFYDLLVHGISNHWIWRCPTQPFL